MCAREEDERAEGPRIKTKLPVLITTPRRLLLDTTPRSDSISPLSTPKDDKTLQVFALCDTLGVILDDVMEGSVSLPQVVWTRAQMDEAYDLVLGEFMDWLKNESQDQREFREKSISLADLSDHPESLTRSPSPVRIDVSLGCAGGQTEIGNPNLVYVVASLYNRTVVVKNFLCGKQEGGNTTLDMARRFLVDVVDYCRTNRRRLKLDRVTVEGALMQTENSTRMMRALCAISMFEQDEYRPCVFNSTFFDTGL